MRLRVIAVLVLALSLLVAPAAMASTWTKTDPRGDAPAGSDLTKLVMVNTRHATVARATVRGLTHAGTFPFVFVSGGRITSVAVRWSGGRATGKLYSCLDDDCSYRRCSGLKIVWDARENFIRLTLPQSCYKRPKRWLFYVDAGIYGTDTIEMKKN